MIKIFSSPYIAECDQLRMLLELAGIRSDIRNEFGHSIGLVITGGVAEFAAPEVWVDDSDHADAMQIVQTFMRSLRDALNPTPETPARDEWHCTHCGETVDAALHTCWNCDAPR
jgi:hypothetical protein